MVDGDTLEVRGTRVRLHGIDAPETKQTCIVGGQRWRCGREATQALARRIGGRPVACEERDRDGYGRAVAVCRVGGKDVNAWMAAEGWAFAYRKYSQRYVAEEAAAKAAGRAESGGARWSRPGIGARASASQPPPRPLGPESVESRGTSAGAGRASTTSPAGSSTRGRASTPRRASAGSARRRRPGRRGGAGRRGNRSRLVESFPPLHLFMSVFQPRGPCGTCPGVRSYRPITAQVTSAGRVARNAANRRVAHYCLDPEGGLSRALAHRRHEPTEGDGQDANRAELLSEPPVLLRRLPRSPPRMARRVRGPRIP